MQSTFLRTLEVSKLEFITTSLSTLLAHYHSLCRRHSSRVPRGLVFYSTPRACLLRRLSGNGEDATKRTISLSADCDWRIVVEIKTLHVTHKFVDDPPI